MRPGRRGRGWSAWRGRGVAPQSCSAPGRTSVSVASHVAPNAADGERRPAIPDQPAEDPSPLDRGRPGPAGRRLRAHHPGVPSGLHHHRRQLRLCGRQGLALRRLAVAGDEHRLVADRSAGARRAEHVPAHRHILLGGLRPARAHRGAPLGVACAGDPAHRAHAARVRVRRHDLARRVVRGGLAARRGDRRSR